MGLKSSRASVLILGFVIGAGVTIPLQLVLPFPYGLQWGAVLFAIIMGVSVVLAFTAIKKDRRTTIEEDANVKAIAILKERLAKGEISKEEYKRPTVINQYFSIFFKNLLLIS